MILGLGHAFDILASKKRWLIHVGFWTFVLILYSILFGQGSHYFLKTLFFVGLLLPVTIGAAYFLNYFLIPRYLLKERYGFFLLYFLYTLVGALFLEMWVVVLTFIVIAGFDMKGMSPSSINIPFLMAALLMIVFLAVAIKMLSYWRKSREDYQILMREKVEAELKFLKMQMNPHFLFNTLNNLYYLASEKSDKAPKAILALSELLDYVLNETRSELVSLDKEIKLITNYIELEKLRYEDRLKVDVRISGDPEQSRIAPMLLLALVENAFKHGAGKTTGQHWINIDIQCSEKKVRACIANSYQPVLPSSQGGIGLQNFKNQMALIYPGRHTLQIEKESATFTVKLELE